MMEKYRSDLEEFMKTIDFEEEPISYLLSVFDKIVSDETCRERLLFHVDRYRDRGEIEFGQVINDAVLSARALRLAEYATILVFDLTVAMYSYPVYEAKGLSRKIWRDTMEDFRFKLNECRRRFGEWGTFVNWFGRFYTAECICLHRLEFEIEYAPCDFKNDEIDIKKGHKVVNVHIPSNEKIPLTKEECDKSYCLAVEYFAKHFDETPLVFMCGSWLLDEGMKDFLPEDSNILRFASEYAIAETGETYDDLWRIYYFREYDGHPENLPEDTALMRGYKRRLMSGKAPKYGIGFKKHK